MLTISVWARSHQWAARFLIAALYIVLTTLGLFSGKLLQLSNVSLPALCLWIPLVLFICGWCFYPSRVDKSKKSTYRQRKTCDLALLFACFAWLVYLGNASRPQVWSLSLHAATQTAAPADSLSKSYKSLADFSKSLRNEQGKPLKWKERRMLLKQQVAGIHASEELNAVDRTILVILCSLAAAAALFGIAALACNLSCSGFGTAAVAVALLGTAAVVILMTMAIRAIYKKKKKTSPPAGAAAPLPVNSLPF